MKRITEVFGRCDDENLYGTASALIRIRDELEKSGEVQNPEALDYFAQTRLECMMTKKLGQLEDVEEEIGIEFITLSKALKKGVYCKCDKCVYYLDLKHTVLNFEWKALIYEPDDDLRRTVLMFKDYGETWALTKEELK